jgi:DNA-binding MarR family transcriptional regulator
MYDAGFGHSVPGSERSETRLLSVATTGDVIGTIELELLRLVRHLETFGRRSSVYAEVDRAGYLALRTLEDIGPASTNALARALHLDASTMTRQLRTLELGGFVERHPDPADGRSTTIMLTSQGRRTMRGVEVMRRRSMEALVGAWSEQDKVSLGHALTMLNSSLIESVATSEIEP